MKILTQVGMLLFIAPTLMAASPINKVEEIKAAPGYAIEVTCENMVSSLENYQKWDEEMTHLNLNYLSSLSQSFKNWYTILQVHEDVGEIKIDRGYFLPFQESKIIMDASINLLSEKTLLISDLVYLSSERLEECLEKNEGELNETHETLISDFEEFLDEIESRDLDQREYYEYLSRQVGLGYKTFRGFEGIVVRFKKDAFLPILELSQGAEVAMYLIDETAMTYQNRFKKLLNRLKKSLNVPEPLARY